MNHFNLSNHWKSPFKSSFSYPDIPQDMLGSFGRINSNYIQGVGFVMFW